MTVTSAKKLGWKKDWPSFFYLVFTMAGFIVSIYDLWKIQSLHFQLGVSFGLGIMLLIIGGYF